jgi:uncharacterized protein YqgQ
MELTDDVLFQLRLDSFESVWQHIEDLYNSRALSITKSYSNCQSLIANRVNDVKAAVKGAIQQLVDIAFLLQPEIEYIFYQDILPINVKIIDTNLALSGIIVNSF